jgi:PAT family beta-lactamase induction signal transducer AmpG
MVLPGKVIAASSGFIVEAVGWFTFFIYASGMGVPAILLTIIVARHDRARTA